MSQYVDYEQLRRAISIEGVVGWLGMEMKKAGEQLRGECPLTGGGERALVVTPSKEQFYCFSPKCKKGGGSLELIAHVHNISLREAALALQAHLYPQGDMRELDYLVSEHEDMQALGMPAHVAKAIGAGRANKGIMAGRCCFPLRDKNGKLVAYIGYSADSEQPIKLPKTFFL